MSAHTPVQMQVDKSQHVKMHVRLDARIGVRRYARNALRFQRNTFQILWVYVSQNKCQSISQKTCQCIGQQTHRCRSQLRIWVHCGIYSVCLHMHTYIYIYMNTKRTVRGSRRYESALQYRKSVWVRGSEFQMWDKLPIQSPANKRQRLSDQSRLTTRYHCKTRPRWLLTQHDLSESWIELGDVQF